MWQCITLVSLFGIASNLRPLGQVFCVDLGACQFILISLSFSFFIDYINSRQDSVWYSSNSHLVTEEKAGLVLEMWKTEKIN